MKQKLVTGLLVGIMVFSLAACQTEDASQKNSSENVQTTQETEQDTDEKTVEEGQDEPAESSSPNSDGNILIAYFSVPEDIDTSGIDADAGASVVVREGDAVGNMQFMAEAIQQSVGGDLFRIETEEDYPLDHDPLVDQAADEQSANARPALSSKIENLEQHETIFVGYPNWWGVKGCQ